MKLFAICGFLCMGLGLSPLLSETHTHKNKKAVHYYKDGSDCHHSKKEDFYEQKSFDVYFQIFQQVLGQDLPIPTDYGDPNLPQALLPFGDAVKVTVQAVKIGNRVTLQIPAMSFTIPDEAGPSYIFTSTKFVPREFRPTTPMPASFATSSHLTDNPPFDDFPATGDYEGHVSQEGLIWFSLPGGYLIPPGQFISEASTVTYICSPSSCPVPNFIIATEGASNANLTFSQVWQDNFGSGHIFDFLEYNGIDMQHGRIMGSWSSNADSPVNDGQGLNISKTLRLAFSRIDVKHRHDKKENPKLETVVPPTYLTPLNQQLFQAETVLAISPYDPNLVAIVSGKVTTNVDIVPPFKQGDL